MSNFIIGLDQRVLEYLVAHRDIATTLSFVGISELGSTIFILGIGMCVGLLLVLRQKGAYAAGLAVSVFGAGGTVFILKEIVHRARPGAAYRAYIETGFSFPSGHATLAVALYGFLIYLAWRMMPAGKGRTLLMAALTLLIALIAFSRLYLGVHYPSDVVAGLLVGGISVWIGSVVVKKFEQRS